MKTLNKDDFLPLDQYRKIRAQKRLDAIQLKKQRSIFIGPDVHIMFENAQTIQAQIQEMLYIEGAKEGQLEDELEAYSGLIPNGSQITTTVLFEIPNPSIRLEKLSSWGGIENTFFLKINNHKIYATNTDNLERTNDQNKTSSVHFLKFDLSDDEKQDFLKFETFIGFDFKLYAHTTLLNDVLKQALSKDFS